MLGTLVAGRISIACASLSAAKSGLTIAVRYTARRRQFGPEDEPEVPVLDYTAMQRLLLPASPPRTPSTSLSTTSSAPSPHPHPAARRRSRPSPPRSRRSLPTSPSTRSRPAAKPAADRDTSPSTASAGSAPTPTSSPPSRAPTSSSTSSSPAAASPSTARSSASSAWHVARYLAGRAATRVAELNPIVTRRTDPDHLLDPGFHAAALRYREERLLASLARRLKRRIDDGMDGFDAFNECQDHAVELGRAFADRFVLERAQAAVDACQDALRRPRLPSWRALRPGRIEAASAWYLEAGYLEAGKSRAVRTQINDLCRSLRPWRRRWSTPSGFPTSCSPRPSRAEA
jgi:acyl-CoA oxidase